MDYEDAELLIEIESLRAELEAVKKERDEVKQVEFPRKVEAVAEGWRKKLAAVTKERDELVAVLKKCQFSLEPYDDVKPRDWKTDRENLARAHQTTKAALAKLGADKTGETTLGLLRRLEQEMRYAGWGEKHADNYERAELYAEVCEFLGDK